MDNMRFELERCGQGRARGLSFRHGKAVRSRMPQPVGTLFRVVCAVNKAKSLFVKGPSFTPTSGPFKSGERPFCRPQAQEPMSLINIDPPFYNIP